MSQALPTTPYFRSTTARANLILISIHPLEGSPAWATSTEVFEADGSEHAEANAVAHTGATAGG
jgi:hypothetical protein